MPKTKNKKTAPVNEGKYEYRVTSGGFYLKGKGAQIRGRMLKKGAIVRSDDPELHKKLVNKLKPVDRDDELAEDEEEEIEIGDSEDEADDEEEEEQEEKQAKRKAKKSKKGKNKKKSKSKKSSKKKDDDDEEDDD